MAKSEVKENTENVSTAAEKTPAEKVRAYMSEKITKEFPYLEGRKEEEQYLYFAINGKNFVIKRGEPVEIPRYVWEVYENMRNQDRLLQAYNARCAADVEKLNRLIG